MITNKCLEGCPHCMECSNPNGAMMDARTFVKAVKFSDFIGCRVITVSGGEPTLHPQFYEFCKMLNFVYKKTFTIVSNGTWIDNAEIVEQVRRICRFENFTGMQVYTNKLFYKDYEKIKANENNFRSISTKILVDYSQIRGMKDLGRAKNYDVAQKMSAESGYFQSCLNASLVVKQVQRPIQYGTILEMTAHQFCHPMVDFNGDVHLSESWLCQSCGNVSDQPFNTIWNSMVGYRPCGKCKDYQRFCESMRPDIIKAKEILNK